MGSENIQDKQLEIIDKYLSGVSCLNLSKTYELSYYKIRCLLLKNNIIIRSNNLANRRFLVNENIFNNIDTQEKAYWLGFIYADGYISIVKDFSPRLGISLAVKDFDHLEKLKQFLSYTGNIKIYTQKHGYNVGAKYSRICVTSQSIVSDLIRHGCVNQKTTILKPPNINNNLINHFIRGYFDGDGSWSIINKPKRSKLGFTFSVCGTQELLEWMKIHLCLTNKLNQKPYHSKNNINQFRIVVEGSNIVYRIMNYLYQDATIYLQRKYDRYVSASINMQSHIKEI